MGHQPALGQQGSNGWRQFQDRLAQGIVANADGR